jgi:hypothetical protein
LSRNQRGNTCHIGWNQGGDRCLIGANSAVFVLAAVVIGVISDFRSGNERLDVEAFDTLDDSDGGGIGRRPAPLLFAPDRIR